MVSMSYCRFENTYRELSACLDHLNDGLDNLSESEVRYREHLVELCQVFINEFLGE